MPAAATPSTCFTFIVVAMVLCAVPAPARSQGTPPPRRGALPEPSPSDGGAGLHDTFELPDPIRLLEQSETPLGTEVIHVRELRVRGATAIPKEELARVTSSYVGRDLDSTGLRGLVDAITRAYVDAGFVTSGATIPDQEFDASTGVLEIEVVEGRLGEIELEGLTMLDEQTVASRIRNATAGPLDVHRLDAALQILLQDPRIERLEARLEPGTTLGMATLRVVVTEAKAWRADLGYSNHTSPSVGSHGFDASFVHLAPLRVGDTLEGSLRTTRGLVDVDLGYEVPIGATPFRLRSRQQHTWSEVVETPFDILDIRNRTHSFDTGIAARLRPTPVDTVEASAVLSYRWSQTTLLGGDFPSEFSSDGESQATVIRAAFEWSRSTRNDAMALRSVLSIGTPWLGATTNEPLADGREVAQSPGLWWAGQLRVVHRFEQIGWVIASRIDVQLTESPLLPFEHIPIGGVGSVRGFRENALANDNGLASSVEVRVPIYEDHRRSVRLEIAPFVDYGRSWAARSDLGAPTTLVSVGAALRLAWRDAVVAEIQVGEGVKGETPSSNTDLQDRGVHLQLGFSY